MGPPVRDSSRDDVRPGERDALTRPPPPPSNDHPHTGRWPVPHDAAGIRQARGEGVWPRDPVFLWFFFRPVPNAPRPR